MPKNSKENVLSLRCAVRQIDVAAHPEERVRQSLLLRMTEELGYPLGFLAVEKELSELPHLLLKNHHIPDRRIDILCFDKNPEGDDFFPLLLIECKAISLTPSVLHQVIGYNHFIRSRFICIANQNEVRTGWYDSMKKDYQFVPFLPSFKELRESVIPKP